MITYGYVKGYMYTGDGTFKVKVRIPTVHGPYSQTDYQGRRPVNYVKDEDLPYYDSVLLPHLPVEGEVVALSSFNEKTAHFFVLGLTGGSYFNGVTNLGGQ